jgi:hypothetical protein
MKEEQGVYSFFFLSSSLPSIWENSRERKAKKKEFLSF